MRVIWHCELFDTTPVQRCAVVADWRPTRPERVAVGTQTCRKYAGPVPRTQLKAVQECNLELYSLSSVRHRSAADVGDHEALA